VATILTYCRRLRRLVNGRTAAYHVGTWRRHFSLFAMLLFRAQQLRGCAPKHPGYVAAATAAAPCMRYYTQNLAD